MQSFFDYGTQKSRFGRGGALLAEQLLVQLRRTAHPELRITSVKGLARFTTFFDPRVWRWLGWRPMRLVSRAWEAEVLPLNYTRAAADSTGVPSRAAIDPGRAAAPRAAAAP